MSENKGLVCRKCNVGELHLLSNDGGDMFTCYKCGNATMLDEVADYLQTAEASLAEAVNKLKIVKEIVLHIHDNMVQRGELNKDCYHTQQDIKMLDKILFKED